MSFSRPICALPCVFLLVSTPTLAVQDDDSEQTSLTAGWDGEVAFIRSGDDAFFMEIGGRVHLDFRAYSADFAPPPTFLVRRKTESTPGLCRGRGAKDAVGSWEIRDHPRPPIRPPTVLVRKDCG